MIAQGQVIGYAANALGGCDTPMSRTVGENIDSRIASLRAQIEALEETKRKLAEPAGILNVRIEDLRQAMSY